MKKGHLMNLNDRPFTSRFCLDGIPTQPDAYNFAWETLDLRWLEYCALKGMNPYTDSVPVDYWVDMRQANSHQLRDGGIVCLSGTRAFSGYFQRMAIPHEYFANFGYPYNLDFSTLGYSSNDHAHALTVAAFRNRRRAAVSRQLVFEEDEPV